MICPKCGRPVDENAVICNGCNFILDTDFLGDEILDEDKKLRPGKGGVDPAVFNLADAVILGSLESKPQSFETADSGFNVKESTGARLYVSGLTKAVMAPDAIPALTDLRVSSIRLSPFEEHVLRFIDGEKPVDHIRREAGLDEAEVKTALATLADKGIVKVIGRALMELGHKAPSAPKKPASRNKARHQLAGSMGGISDETDRAIEEAFRTETGVGPLSESERESLQAPEEDGTGVFSEIGSSIPQNQDSSQAQPSSLESVSALPLSNPTPQQPLLSQEQELEPNQPEENKDQAGFTEDIATIATRPKHAVPNTATKQVPPPHFSRDSDGFDSFGAPSEVIQVTAVNHASPFSSQKSENEFDLRDDSSDMADVFADTLQPLESDGALAPVNRKSIDQIAYSGLIDADDFREFTQGLSISHTTPAPKAPTPSISDPSHMDHQENSSEGDRSMDQGQNTIVVDVPNKSSSSDSNSSHSGEEDFGEATIAQPVMNLDLDSEENVSKDGPSERTNDPESVGSDLIIELSSSNQNEVTDPVKQPREETSKGGEFNKALTSLEQDLPDSEHPSHDGQDLGDDSLVESLSSDALEEDVFSSGENSHQSEPKSNAIAKTAYSVVELPSDVSEANNELLSLDQFEGPSNETKPVNKASGTDDEQKDNQNARVKPAPKGEPHQSFSLEETDTPVAQMIHRAAMDKADETSESVSVGDQDVSSNDSIADDVSFRGDDGSSASSDELESSAIEDVIPAPQDDQDGSKVDSGTHVSDVSEVGLALSELSIGVADSGIFRVNNLSAERSSTNGDASDSSAAEHEPSLPESAPQDDVKSNLSEENSPLGAPTDERDHGSPQSDERFSDLVSREDNQQDLSAGFSQLDETDSLKPALGKSSPSRASNEEQESQSGQILTSELYHALESDDESAEYSSSSVFTSSGQNKVAPGAGDKQPSPNPALSDALNPEKSNLIIEPDFSDSGENSEATVQFEVPSSVAQDDAPSAPVAYELSSSEPISATAEYAEGKHQLPHEELEDDDSDDNDVTHIRDQMDIIKNPAGSSSFDSNIMKKAPPPAPLSEEFSGGQLEGFHEDPEDFPTGDYSAMKENGEAKSSMGSVEYIEEDMIIRPSANTPSPQLSSVPHLTDTPVHNPPMPELENKQRSSLLSLGIAHNIEPSDSLLESEPGHFPHDSEDDLSTHYHSEDLEESDLLEDQSEKVTRHESLSHLPAPAGDIDPEATEFLHVGDSLKDLAPNDASLDWEEEHTEDINTHNHKGGLNRSVGGQASRVLDEVMDSQSDIESDLNKISLEEQPADKTRQGRELFERALADYEAGYINRAKQNAKLASICDPSNDEYRATIEQWEAEEARQEAEDNQGPEIELYQRAHKCEASGDIDGAIELLEQGIAMQPNLAPFHNRLGVILAINKGEYMRAARYVKAAVELEPDNMHYRNNLGKIVAKGGIELDSIE